MANEPEMMLEPPTDEQEAFFTEAVEIFKALVKKYKSMRTIECIAIFGKIAGYGVAMCHPEDRAGARKTVIRNMDLAMSEVDGERKPR